VPFPWFAGTGSGLVAGIGSGIAGDGRGWHSLGARLEASHRAALHEEYCDNDAVQGAVQGAAAVQRGVREAGSATGVGGEEAELLQVLQTVLHDAARDRPAATGGEADDEAAGEPTPEAVAGELAEACADATEQVAYADAWVLALAAQQGTEAGTHGFEGGDDGDEGDAEWMGGHGAAQDTLLAPRIGRGGRLVFDRVPAAARGHHSVATAGVFARAADRALRLRRDGTDRVRCRAWMALLAGLQTLLPAHMGAALQLAARAPVTAAVRALLASSRRRLPVLSPYELLQGTGFAADPADPHAAHVAAFGHYTAMPGHRAPRSEHLHSQSTGLMHTAAGGTCSLAVRGLESALLAPSRFSRVGDEMSAAVQQASACQKEGAAAAAFGDALPVASVTGTSACLARIADAGWDAFLDADTMRPAGKRRRPTEAALQQRDGLEAMLAVLGSDAVRGVIGESCTDPDLLRDVMNAASLRPSAKRQRRGGQLEDVGHAAVSLFSACADACSWLGDSREAESIATGGVARSGLHRDAAGIPIAGAHTSRSAVHGAPASKFAGGDAVLDMAALLHKSAPSSGIAAAVARGLARQDEKFREMWAREGDSDDEQLPPVFQGSRSSFPGGSVIDTHFASACFEEATLQPFEAQLRAEEGT
jgi:hypothetical protein